MIDLSIVIVNWNTEELLKQCITSIYENVFAPDFELIVVDNGSQDNSIKMLKKRFPQVRVIANRQNLGFSKANNQGIQKSKGRYILFLNSDTIILPQSIEKMIMYMENHPKVGILGPRLVDEPGKIIQMSWGWHPSFLGEAVQKFFNPSSVQRYWFFRKWVEWFQKKERKVPFVAGASLLARRCALEQIGSFDEQFALYLEDSDLCRRMWKGGWRVMFFPEARVVHLLGKSIRERWGKVALVYRQSQLYFHRKHCSKLDWFLLKGYLWLKFTAIFLLSIRAKTLEAQARREFCREMFRLLQNRLIVSL